MHIAFALPGLHRVARGAEVVFESVAQEIALGGRHQVTLIGSGQPQADRAYDFRHVPAVSRDRFERWPKTPFLRSEFVYEDLTFAAWLVRAGLGQADLTVTCNYPYSNWALRGLAGRLRRCAHVFVTQNGDWPVHNRTAEARFFACDGLICTNPIYFERNKDQWPSALIPNGVDPACFHPGGGRRAALGLPAMGRLVLMVSALEPGKRVLEAMRAVALVDDAFLVVAGDGPLREEVDRLAAELLPDRFLRATFQRDDMPDVYRSADLFLHTKIEESFGNVYVEALSCGLPVVAHDDAVSRWILGRHARLVDSRSSEILAQAVREELAAAAGPRLETAAWAHANYAWSGIAKRYEDFFVETYERTCRN